MGTKSEKILFAYNKFLKGEEVREEDIISKFQCSRRTAKRILEEVMYSENLIGKVLRKEDVLIINKILLDSRGLNKKELNNLIDKLMNNLCYEDKMLVNKFIGNEVLNYVELQHKSDIIDKVWDLTSHIRNQDIIKIKYTKVDSTGKIAKIPKVHTILPQGILFSEFYFYLLGYIKKVDNEFPCIFRIDRLIDFEPTGEKFKITYSERFEEGKFKNKVFFMQSGKNQNIKFRFKGESIEAILDKIPTAQAIEDGNGNFIVRCQAIGRGIKMWLLSQGAAIEILEPEYLRDEFKEEIRKMMDNYK